MDGIFSLYNYFISNFSKESESISITELALSFEVPNTKWPEFAENIKNSASQYPNVLYLDVSRNIPQVAYQRIFTTPEDFSEIVDHDIRMYSPIVNIKLKLDVLRNTLNNYASSTYNVSYFFSEENFLSYLRYDYSKLENLLDPHKYNILFVNSAKSFTLINDYLIITSNLGISVPDSLNIINIEKANLSIEKARKMYAKWESGPNWINPNYFHFNNIQCVDSVIQSAIVTGLSRLSLAYLACSTCFNDSTITHNFESYKNSSFSFEDNDNLNLETYDLIYSIFNFVYSDEPASKLSIFKNILSLSMTSSEKTNSQHFIANLSSIHSALESNYNIYTKDKIKIWFDERKRIVDYISDQSIKISTQVESLTKNLTSSITTFIAVLIASLVPAVLRSNFDVVKYALMIYAISLGFSALYFYVTSYVNILNIKKDVEEHEQFAKSVMTESEINLIQASVLLRRFNQFYTYFTINLILILISIAALVFIYNNFDALINGTYDWGISEIIYKSCQRML